MKKRSVVLLTLFFTFAQMSFLANAHEVCQEKLDAHLELIQNTNDYFESVALHSKKITSFEIVQLQKKLTGRFLNLKDLLKTYADDSLECDPKVMARAVAVYDFENLKRIIFKNNELRRVVFSLVKFKDYQLTDLLDQYEKYTSKKVIDKILSEIKKSESVLPEGMVLKKSKYNSDPTLHSPVDRAMKGASKVVAVGALALGFISDHTKWRQGRLKHDLQAKNLILEKIKPLDLIFEQRKFTISNYTIPGAWGHVAVWLGTKEELIAMNIWDQEYFKPFQKYVEEGLNIMEIRKTGLNFQSIDTFLNLDDIAVTRVHGALENAESIYQELAAQAHKKYDYEFNARSADRITCAELITFSYGDIKWPETKTFFQINLRPDDLALLSLKDPSREELILYLSGNKDAPLSILGFDDWEKLISSK